MLIENFRPGAMEGRGLAPEDLLERNPRLIVLCISGDITPPGREVTSARGVGMIVDGSIVRQDDRAAYARGAYARMPRIVGSNANEGGGTARSHPVKTSAQLRDLLTRNFTGFETRAQQVYAASADAEVQPVLSDLMSDTQHLFGTREMLRVAAPREPRTYRYVFTQQRKGAATAPIHGDELQYPFDNLNALHRGRVRPSDASDAKVASEMADAWTRSTKTGDPNGGNLPAWPPFTAQREEYLDFGREIRAAAFGPSPRLDLIREYYARQR